MFLSCGLILNNLNKFRSASRFNGSTLFLNNRYFFGRSVFGWESGTFLFREGGGLVRGQGVGRGLIRAVGFPTSNVSAVLQFTFQLIICLQINPK